MAGRSDDRRVLICGGGIAGLTLAILLKERGWRPLVLEREPELRVEGYMMDFFGSGWDVAERMGLTEALRAVRYPIERLQFVDRDGATTIDVPIERVTKVLKGRYVYLRRSDLERILHRRAIGAGIEIRFGTSVLSLNGDDERCVSARLTSGEEESFDLAFGADGVHSRVRAFVFGAENAFDHYLGGYVAAFHLPKIGLDLGHALKLHEETDRVAALYPLSDEAADATFVFRHPNIGQVPAEERLPLLKEKMAGPGWVSSRLLEEIPAATPVYFDALTQIKMPTWHRGRIALLGDACGCLTLLAGQGSHMAMAGAFVLAAELGRHDDHQSAFRAYEARMRPAVVKRQVEAERFARIAIPSKDSRPWLRHLVTRLFLSPLGLKLGLNSFGAKSVLKGYS